MELATFARSFPPVAWRISVGQGCWRSSALLRGSGMKETWPGQAPGKERSTRCRVALPLEREIADHRRKPETEDWSFRAGSRSEVQSSARHSCAPIEMSTLNIASGSNILQSVELQTHEPIMMHCQQTTLTIRPIDFSGVQWW